MVSWIRVLHDVCELRAERIVAALFRLPPPLLRYCATALLRYCPFSVLVSTYHLTHPMLQLGMNERRVLQVLGILR